jgi:transcription elongation factor S-II
MDPEQRRKSLQLLTKCRNFNFCRELESIIHSKSETVNDYNNNILRCAWNLHHNDQLNSLDIIFQPDKNLIKNTILERIDKETKARSERFEKMLQEKYDSINDKQYSTLIKCRRCGSEEISYDEKQTKSADEAATIFCSCSTCKQRWIMR